MCRRQCVSETTCILGSPRSQGEWGGVGWLWRVAAGEEEGLGKRAALFLPFFAPSGAAGGWLGWLPGTGTEMGTGRLGRSFEAGGWAGERPLLLLSLLHSLGAGCGSREADGAVGGPTLEGTAEEGSDSPSSLPYFLQGGWGSPETLYDPIC